MVSNLLDACGGDFWCSGEAAMIEVMAKLLTRCVELVVVDGGGGEVILADVTIALGKLVAWKSITPSDDRVGVCISTIGSFVRSSCSLRVDCRFLPRRYSLLILRRWRRRERGDWSAGTANQRRRLGGRRTSARVRRRGRWWRARQCRRRS